MSITAEVLNSLRREERICDLAIKELVKRCETFERHYQMSSDEFYARFTHGQLGDDEDYFEWKALIDGVRYWQSLKEALSGLKE